MYVYVAYMCVCMCMYVHVYVYVCMCMYVYVCVCGGGVWTSVHACEYVCMYGLVVSMFDFHRSDRGLNPGQGGKIFIMITTTLYRWHGCFDAEF